MTREIQKIKKRTKKRYVKLAVGLEKKSVKLSLFQRDADRQNSSVRPMSRSQHIFNDKCSREH